MTSKFDDYFRYFIASPEIQRWGLGITAAGHTRISAGTAYPPAQHPDDHLLSWEHGRVLDALQIVLITSGWGWLETRATGKCRVKDGMVFLILPGTWHRYRPDPNTGWTESWVEMQGPVVNNLLLAGSFPATSVLRDGAIRCGMEESLDSIHRLIRQGVEGFQPELSADALRLLALFFRCGQNTAQTTHIQKVIHQAELYLTEHHAEPINVEELAAKLGVAYSHFRREFLAQTGFSPWKYVIHLRLTRARRMLASSDAKLDDIAERVGFGSGFHLSNAFKRAFGESPAKWRQNLMKIR